MSNLLNIQEEICKKYGSKFEPINPQEMIAVAIDSVGKMPINGIRHFLKGNEKISWFLYCGEFSEKIDFFKPMHAEHLKDFLPEAIPFLALEKGFRFIIDDSGYEDVWTEDEDED